MIRLFLSLIFVFSLTAQDLLAQQALIPQPVSLETAEGQATIDGELGLVMETGNEALSKMLDNFASDLESIRVKVSSAPEGDSTASTLLKSL